MKFRGYWFNKVKQKFYTAKFPHCYVGFKNKLDVLNAAFSSTVYKITIKTLHSVGAYSSTAYKVHFGTNLYSRHAAYSSLSYKVKTNSSLYGSDAVFSSKTYKIKSITRITSSKGAFSSNYYKITYGGV